MGEMKNETQTFEAKKQKAQVAADEAAEAEEEVKKAEEGGFDPTAAGAQETILNLKDKIAVMKKKKAYAEQVSVVNSMNEMKFKVEAKTPEAVKAKATVDDVEEGVPSVNGAVEERLRKSRDKYKMKELEEKAKVPDDPEPEGWDTLNKKPKKKDPVDLLTKTGAAIGLELREAVNDAKDALQHKDNNPGDKRAEIRAGEALERVALLTKQSQRAVEHDSKVQRNAQKEMDQKIDAVQNSRVLADKKIDLKEKELYSSHLRTMRENKFEAESMEMDIKFTKKQKKIYKKLGALARDRYKARLEHDRVVAKEAGEKRTMRLIEKDRRD